MKRLLILFFISLSFSYFAQYYTLSGKIIGEKGERLPFSSVLIKGTTQGANANAEGAYTIKLLPGTYELIFQYVGYKKHIEKIEITASNIQKDISLIPESYELKEVVIKDGEDPAYPVIRQAIKKRSDYLNQVGAYSCNAYIKGLQRLKDFPLKMVKLINAINTTGEKIDSTLLGVVYLSESESKYYFRKPNDEKEVMYSSRISGDNKAFSFNKASDMKFNLYQNLVSLEGLSDHPFVSPISENALWSYRYKLLGTTFEDGKMINKIQVIPKRATDPCFRGVIYIQENTWRIHSIDLFLPKETKINFVDTIKIKQLHAPVNDSVWMPTSLNLSFSFKVLGFIGDGYFNAIFSDYNLNPDFSKRFFKNEVLKVEEGSNKKDSSYWQNTRPIPLTEEEQKDYRRKDSIGVIKNSTRYKDSLDKEINKLKLSKLFVGYTYNKSSKQLSIVSSGLLTSGVQYNTVEGVNASVKIDATKQNDNFKNHHFSGSVRYGFSNYLWGGVANYKYAINPMKFSSVNITAGSMATQFNGNEPINPTINTSYSLFNNDNFMKLYKKTFASLIYKQELINGLIGTIKAEYAERAPLKNTTNDLWIDDKHKLFTSNDPQHFTTDDSCFKTNNSFVIEIGASIRFKQKYITKPYQKIIEGSKFPIINILYTKAIAGLNTKADYDLLKMSIDDHIQIGMLGTFSYKLKGGYFFNTRYMEFMDYKHFDGNQTILANNNYLNSFKLLPYYTYSTKNWFAEAHAEHHFNGFIFNKLPVLKKTRIQEVVGAHVLFNDKMDQYYEINFGIERLFQIVRVDYVLGYGPYGKFTQGFVIGLGINF